MGESTISNIGSSGLVACWLARHWRFVIVSRQSRRMDVRAASKGRAHIYNKNYESQREVQKRNVCRRLVCFLSLPPSSAINAPLTPSMVDWFSRCTQLYASHQDERLLVVLLKSKCWYVVVLLRVLSC